MVPKSVFLRIQPVQIITPPPKKKQPDKEIIQLALSVQNV